MSKYLSYFAGWTNIEQQGQRISLDSELSLPLAEVEDVELELLLELDLDVAHDEERHREVDVDPAVIPPDLVDLGHVGGDAGLLDLEL